MKKTLIFAAALLACACSTDKYTIQGNIEGAEGYLYLSNGETVVDSTAVKEGAFRFEGKATTPQALYLTDNRDLAQATFIKAYTSHRSSSSRVTSAWAARPRRPSSRAPRPTTATPPTRAASARCSTSTATPPRPKSAAQPSSRSTTP